MSDSDTQNTHHINRQNIKTSMNALIRLFFCAYAWGPLSSSAAITTIIDSFSESSLNQITRNSTIEIDGSKNLLIFKRNDQIEMGKSWDFGTYDQFGVVSGIFGNAVYLPTHFEIPVVFATEGAFLQLNASYVGGGGTWSGTRSYAFYPKTGDVLKADLSYALQAVSGFGPASFYNFSVFIPNSSGSTGTLTIGSPIISQIPEPSTSLFFLCGSIAVISRRKK